MINVSFYIFSFARVLTTNMFCVSFRLSLPDSAFYNPSSITKRSFDTFYTICCFIFCGLVQIIFNKCAIVEVVGLIRWESIK